MNTASKEWAERVEARNAIETAKATKRPEYIQMKFLWNAIDLEADAPRASQPEGGAKRPEYIQTQFLWNAIDLEADAPRASQPEGGAK